MGITLDSFGNHFEITCDSFGYRLGITRESLGQHRLDYPLLGLHTDYTFEMVLCGMGAFVYDMTCTCFTSNAYQNLTEYFFMSVTRYKTFEMRSELKAWWVA